ncbi:MAG TPA: radical SAM protein [Rectinemataceae bacterium]|nr:radical SAM protein [Rectinemataceae bacterium]
MKAVLVQPPFVQLNSPYPAIHYLEAFLRGRGHETEAFDHSIALYRRIFSRQGLSTLFTALKARLSASGGEEGKLRLAPAARIEVERYLSYESLYLEWIEPLMHFLGKGDAAFAHRLAQAVELPQGARSAALLESEGGRISSDQARVLATCMLEDLGDLIGQVLDPQFGTVRYGERIAASRGDFAEIVAALNSSYLLESFYRPFLSDFWQAAPVRGADLILISIPFPGSLLGALACATAARAALSPKARILFGGGYVSTELRSLSDGGIFDFCDYLCFDAGYGSLCSILEREGLEAGLSSPAGGLYRSMYRTAAGRIAVSGFPEAERARPVAGRELREWLECPDRERYARMEDEALAGTFPDYRGLKLDDYLGFVDSANPMHRLWSDAPWLKYHLAHGCYWRRCSFCDTELDYVAHFLPGRLESLMSAADAAARSTGRHGIHFVDEAMPMAALLGYAVANRQRAASGRTPFSFWGNMRFDASWTPDRCEFLAASGLVAVSGGIEIATERGLAMTDKGFTLAGLVRCLVALKRSGILVHAYLIYGFPGQGAADIIDSAELCRQLFAAGLVDSAFWHRFVLTRHSPLYRDWKRGRLPGLKPSDSPRPFADNDLSFEGEDQFDGFDGPLVEALAAWMAGLELDRPAAAWFAAPGTAPVPESSVPPDRVETLIAQAESEFDSAGHRDGSTLHWVAGAPLVRDPSTLVWAYRGGLETLRQRPEAVKALCDTILALSRRPEGMTRAEFLGMAGGAGSDGPPIVAAPIGAAPDRRRDEEAPSEAQGQVLAQFFGRGLVSI